jgi:predicted KAP-like P-loop ATPase
MTETKTFLFDSPETNPEKDEFGRSKFSDSLGAALHKLLSKDSPVLNDSFVLALTGPWGSGKTTVMEFALNSLQKHCSTWGKSEQPIIHRFDPWLFSEPSHILSAFLKGLADTLSLPDHGEELKRAGQIVKAYEFCIAPASWLTAAAGIPGVGKGVELLKQIRETLNASAELVNDDTSSFRKAISEQIKKQPRRILIVIDDIDRLTKQEIRLLMQVIKLTANFSNVVYLLLFEQKYVETALDDISANSGRDYLKKIIQVDYRLPPIDRELVRRNFFREFRKILPEYFNVCIPLKVAIYRLD